MHLEENAPGYVEVLQLIRPILGRGEILIAVQ
ncbi:hypothetical protein ROA7450_01391 [Roseovarius albus]|uniref:Uncharacterized protein n=1 Tax=Roseovarius albus TaxID=1247867 RepID=A0A1X6YTV0_9RHOB|nr:hypothetical protein ROA7450_01391 [Roseovarius albus]